jgi:hypothetical protein
MDDCEELVSRLLTLAGAIMEDASAIAIIGEGNLPLAERAAVVSSAAADAGLLAQAAAIALRRR